MDDASARVTEQSPLLTAVNAKSQIHLIIGTNPLAAARCTKCLEVGAIPIIIGPSPDSKLPSILSQRAEKGGVQWLQRDFRDDDLSTLGREEVDRFVDAVFITLGRNDPLSSHISKLCRRFRIPVNVSDAPELCSFTLLSTYSDGPLHIGVTTSGKGCSLSSRIRREIASYLPPGLGVAVEILGSLRKRIWEEDVAAEKTPELKFEADDDSTAQKHTFNSLVLPEDDTAAKTRRMRWLSQICEYWPLRRLANITAHDMEKLLAAYGAGTLDGVNGNIKHKQQGQAKIILAGSGPGHPDLITRATYQAIKTADLILADKLVPAAVLDLIPRRTELHIARKFPGNADKAQDELLQMGMDGLRANKKVLRLKQGDPYLYGRGAEEYSFFREHGHEPIVLPGITSSLCAPLFAGIPPTHRGVADQVLICTGTGRHGVAPEPPTYIPTQTVVFLMALHRLASLVESMTCVSPDEKSSVPPRNPWPRDTPCAVIERASCADQRVIRSTLEHVCMAVQEEGSRPPGLLVVGNSCTVLHNTSKKWLVEDGFKKLDGLSDDKSFDVIRQLGATQEA